LPHGIKMKSRNPGDMEFHVRAKDIKWKMSQPDHIEPDVGLFVGDQATLETGSYHSYNAARERCLCLGESGTDTKQPC